MFPACLAVVGLVTPPPPQSHLIFPPQSLHNHGSCVVECSNGDLLACWYRGSGERSADDVAVMGARLRRGARAWGKPFVMTDTPGFPDTNPCMVIDPQRRLWLFWSTILDNHWESALTKFLISTDYERSAGPPRWRAEKVLHLKPGPEFLAAVQRDLPTQWAPYRQAASPADREKLDAYLAERLRKAGDKLSVRLGWMTRAHPFVLDERRLLVPLYSDGFDFSLMAITGDGGATWQVSTPLVGPGDVQPTIARRRDGTLVAFFRDNGPPPQRVMVAESTDDGLTWSLARDTDVPDPGAGLEVLALRSGRWILVHNGTERGRHQLAVSVSEDEGRTWRVARYLDRDDPGPNAGSYSYPSVIQARDGSLHATYSFTPNAAEREKAGRGESIKYVRFTEEWLLEGLR
ncbi:MAG: exo-alpha-sialidase [Chthonomonadales bacterium]|nr:exo-alpha-sialidase [Chthonomonadales bacterium]